MVGGKRVAARAQKRQPPKGPAAAAATPVYPDPVPEPLFKPIDPLAPAAAQPQRPVVEVEAEPEYFADIPEGLVQEPVVPALEFPALTVLPPPKPDSEFKAIVQAVEARTEAAAEPVPDPVAETVSVSDTVPTEVVDQTEVDAPAVLPRTRPRIAAPLEEDDAAAEAKPAPADPSPDTAAAAPVAAKDKVINPLDYLQEMGAATLTSEPPKPTREELLKRLHLKTDRRRKEPVSRKKREGVKKDQAELERMLTECNGDVALLCQRMGVDPKAIPAITQMAQSMVEKKAQEVTRGARK